MARVEGYADKLCTDVGSQCNGLRECFNRLLQF